MIRFCIILSILTGLTYPSFSQNTYAPQNHALRFYSYNLLLNGIIGATGSALNKEEDEKFFKSFAHGFIKGSIGGFFIVQGKSLAYSITKHDQLWIGYPARITHSIGTSIVANAARNKKFYDSFYFNYGVFRLEWKVLDQKFYVKLRPYIAYTYLFAFKYGELDIKRSLEGSVPYFNQKELLSQYNHASGYTYGGQISIYPSHFSPYIFAHELVHVMQYDEYSNIHYVVFNKRINDKLKSFSLLDKINNKVGKYIFLDIPYHLIAYFLEMNSDCVYKNIFEYEARYFALRSNPYIICHW